MGLFSVYPRALMCCLVWQSSSSLLLNNVVSSLGGAGPLTVPVMYELGLSGERKKCFDLGVVLEVLLFYAFCHFDFCMAFLSIR